MFGRDETSGGQPIEKTKALLARWARDIRDEIGAEGVYVFGSLIYRDGAQFGDRSDIDLVVVLNETPDGVDRAELLGALLPRKIVLEDQLGKLLRRASRGDLICSVLVVTALEVTADIHKDGARDFFSKNAFYDLISDRIVQGLDRAGSRPIRERLVGECIRFAQKVRNECLAVNALGDGKLAAFDDADDAAPKRIMRHAAMVRYLGDQGDGDPGAEYDVDSGATELSVLLNDRRKRVLDLQRRFEARRGGRAAREALSANDQLILTELVLDAAIQLEAKAAAVDAKPTKPSTRGAHSTVVFAQRFASAFPGVRGVEWFDDPDDIKQRLGLLLADPLEFEDATPIWWSRGSSNLHISSFREEGDHILINVEEMNVARVAAVNQGSYKYNFVYLDVAAMSPTGLYPSTNDRIAEVEKGEGTFSYYWEEYGIVDGQHLITRAVYDDGSAKIEGKLQSIHQRSELRSRYVTRFNFLIAAGGAPLLDQSYDYRLEEHLDAMLKGEDRLAAIASEANRLPTGRF